MRFEQYLTEVEYKGGSRVSGIIEDQVVDLIKTKAKHNFKALMKNPKTAIYRGAFKMVTFGLGDSSKSEPRKSANTTNYYTLFMDNDTSWSKFPKRSKSFICSSGDYAGSFGDNQYIVLPFDGVDIGVCSDTDLWGSFKHLKDSTTSDIEDMNDILEKIFDDVNIKDSDKDWKTLQQAMKLVSDKFNEKGDPNYFEKIITSSWDRDFAKWLDINWKGSFEKTLRSLLDPKKNKFALTDFTKLKKHVPDNRSGVELWLEGPALFFNMKTFSTTTRLIEYFKDKV